jgi:hypothetical protein
MKRLIVSLIAAVAALTLGFGLSQGPSAAKAPKQHVDAPKQHVDTLLQHVDGGKQHVDSGKQHVD